MLCQWGVRAEQCGAVTFLQRFGSALNLNLHFHTLALDGAYTYVAGRSAAPRFLLLPPPGSEEVERVLAGTARRVRRLLEARAEGDEDALARDEPLLALLAAASLRTRIATGPHRGERWRRLGDCVEPHEADVDPDATPRVPQYGGMSLHAAVGVPARDRRRLERLCRYVARPPLAGNRLEERSDGGLTLRLKNRWRDGTTHILMEPGERLVPLIPPPRAHQVRYHGILAPCSSQRDRVAPAAPAAFESIARASEGGKDPPRRDDSAARAPAPPSQGEPRQSRSDATTPRATGSAESCDARPAGPRARRLRWAALLQRVFDVDALRCPRCGSTLRLIAAIEDPTIARQILECIGLPARAPPLTPARASHGSVAMKEALEEAGWGFDQTPDCEEP